MDILIGNVSLDIFLMLIFSFILTLLTGIKEIKEEKIDIIQD